MNEPEPQSMLRMLKSVMLTILGVHSKQNTEEDLSGRNIGVYIGVFALMVLTIMLIFASIVSSVLPDK